MGKTKGSFGFHWVQHKHAWGHTRLCCSFFRYVREKPWRKGHDWRPNQDSAFEPAKSRILRPKARWYPFNVVGHHFRDKTPQVAPQYRIRCRIRCRIRSRIRYHICTTSYNINTSGNTRSRSIKGRFKRRILIRSPVMCFPSWFFTYISKKWAA